jgi:hypothetical protein
MPLSALLLIIFNQKHVPDSGNHRRSHVGPDSVDLVMGLQVYGER